MKCVIMLFGLLFQCEMLARRSFATSLKHAAFGDAASWSTKEFFKAAHDAPPVSFATLQAVADAACLDVGASEADSEPLRRDLGQMIAYVRTVQRVAQTANDDVEPLLSTAPTSLRRASLLDDDAAAMPLAVAALERDQLLRHSRATEDGFYVVNASRDDSTPS